MMSLLIFIAVVLTLVAGAPQYLPRIGAVVAPVALLTGGHPNSYLSKQEIFFPGTPTVFDPFLGFRLYR